MARRKVLVIDDEKDIHAALRAIFQARGDQVLSALDPVQGLMLARQAKPDLIVLDINMPGGGGYTAYERFSTLAGTMEIPILVYTAVPLQEVEGRIPKSPTTAILSKPAAPEAIAAAAEKLLGS
jgi:CheY-like chemotaxis protein